MTNTLAVAAPQTQLAVRDALTIDELVAQVATIQQAMKAVMKQDEHYGTIPGTNKPTLLKPGAEKLCLLFRFDPEYDVKLAYDGPHLAASATCTLWHITSGTRVASGFALCSTRETKYAYRNAERVCPACKKPAIIKGREEYGGGWLCFKKKDGCGAKFGDTDKLITEQPTGRVENPDLADTHNTVAKMACKRALIAAVLNGTGASDIFTQDLEDLPLPTEEAGPGEKPPSADVAPESPAHTPDPASSVEEAEIVEPPRVNMVTNPQLKKIWAIAHVLEAAGALTEEMLRQGVKDAYDVDSMKRLTFAQASELIERLQALEERVRGQAMREGSGTQ